MLSLFLIGFILFSILIAALVPNENTYNPHQVEQNRSIEYQAPVTEIFPNGTIINYNGTFFASQTTWVNNCSGHGCGWWMARLVLLLAVIALALFVLAFAFATFGVASEESLYLRSNVARTGGVYGGIEVVGAPASFLGSLICAILGLFAIFTAILVAVYVATGRHQWAFIASVIILAVFAILAALVLLMAWFRNEAPIVVQPVYAAVPVTGVSGQQQVPAVGAPYL